MVADLRMKPATRGAYELLHDGCNALSRVEHNGIRIDTDYLREAVDKADAEIRRYEKQLVNDKEVYPVWRRVYGHKLNLGSKDQLAAVLFDHMKYEAPGQTETGKHKADEQAFSKVDLDFVKAYNRLEKTKKMRGTYLNGIMREVVDGYIHPFFNLHTVVTYRSSSDRINFQNIPVRDAEIGPMIRRCFASRPGHRLVEVDYAGIEVKIAYCYHQDPNMGSYLEDKSRDMHRDAASRCYLLKKEEVSKLARYCAKNMFVFPQFYGDYYKNSARSMWDAIDKMNLKTESGLGLKEHLASRGIKKRGNCDPKEREPQRGSFEEHIRKVEDVFWKRDFPVYAAWKKTYHASYLRDGGFSTKTGFCIKAVLGKNDVLNYPIQGSAFHCLLWSLIEIQKWLTKHNMKTLIVGQIHDSILLDVAEDEYDDVMPVVQRIMTQRLRKKWPWIITGLEVEAEATTVDGHWSEKKAVEIAA